MTTNKLLWVPSRYTSKIPPDLGKIIAENISKNAPKVTPFSHLPQSLKVTPTPSPDKTPSTTPTSTPPLTPPSTPPTKIKSPIDLVGTIKPVLNSKTPVLPIINNEEYIQKSGFVKEQHLKDFHDSYSNKSDKYQEPPDVSKFNAIYTEKDIITSTSSSNNTKLIIKEETASKTIMNTQNIEKQDALKTPLNFSEPTDTLKYSNASKQTTVTSSNILIPGNTKNKGTLLTNPSQIEYVSKRYMSHIVVVNPDPKNNDPDAKKNNLKIGSKEIQHPEIVEEKCENVSCKDKECSIPCGPIVQKKSIGHATHGNPKLIEGTLIKGDDKSDLIGGNKQQNYVVYGKGHKPTDNQKEMQPHTKNLNDRPKIIKDIKDAKQD